MDEIDPKEAAARIKDALGDRPDKAFCGVTAGDVVAVADAVPAERKTKTTDALRQGAANCGGPLERTEVYQVAGQLRHLLAKYVG